MNRNIPIIPLGVIIFLAACSSGAGSGAGGAGTGGAGPSGGTFMVACDNPIGAMAASAVHICDNYYANAGPALQTLTMVAQTLCTAGGGTILNSPCTTANSVGGCVINPYGGGSIDGGALSAGNTYGYYEVQFFYSPGATVASTQANCEGQGTTYVSPGGGGSAAGDGGI